jgi:protein phosphatase
MSGIDPKQVAIASLSDIGRHRDTNQDFCDVFESPSGSRLLVVADGMGGHRGGATASRIATETIGERFQAGTGESADILFDAITAANQQVHQQSIDDPELRGMGTTVVALLFDAEGLVWVAHVGDSRAYRLHAAGMEQITQDHSVVGEMVRRGLITPEEAEVHPRRNEILRSVGVEEQVDIDVAQVLSAPGDFFILCSDGLTGLVSDSEIAKVVKAEVPEDAARRLIEMANDSGGLDNITVQIALVPSDENQAIHYQPPVGEVATETRPFDFKLWIALAIAGLIVGYFVISASGREPDSASPEAAIETRAEDPGANRENSSP